MIATLAVLTAAVLATATQTDTTFAVRPGARLELNNFGGDISVQTWARNSVRIEAEHASRTVIRIDDQQPTIEVSSSHRHGIPSTVDYRLTVPRWMALELSGVNSDIAVLGSEGQVEASSVQGEVSVTGAAKGVKAMSVEGEVRVTGARGKVECNSVNAGVRVEKVRGEVSVSSVNGEIVLEDIESADLEATTVNGEIRYDGGIRDGGSYRFSTHNGSVSVGLPDPVNATVSVATFNGEFSSDFPLQLNETRRGKRFSFTLGSGSARIELESFQGEIQLRRPGSARAGQTYRHSKEIEKEKEKLKARGKAQNQDPNSDPDDENPDDEEQP